MVETKRDALAAAVDDGAVDARRLRRLPAARPQLPARRRAARRASGSPTCETVREPGPRLIGNVAIEVDLGDGPAAARRLREPRRPHLPRRRRRRRWAGSSRGSATTARTATRASARDNLIGTYLHGPLLPKNAWLADRLIAAGARAPRRRRAGARAAGRRAGGRRPRVATSGERGDASRRRRIERRRSWADARPGLAAARAEAALAAGGRRRAPRPRPARRPRPGSTTQLGDPVARLDRKASRADRC